MEIKYSSKFKSIYEILTFELARRAVVFLLPVLMMIIFFLMNNFRSYVKKPFPDSPRWLLIISIIAVVLLFLFFVINHIYRYFNYVYLFRPQEIKLVKKQNVHYIPTSDIKGFKIFKEEIAIYVGQYFDRKIFSFGILNESDFKYVIGYFEDNRVKELSLYEKS